MSEAILIDANVITHLNHGSQKAADALRKLMDSGAIIYISPQAYNELTSQPGKMVGGIGPDLPRTATANKMLIQDLGIKIAPAPPATSIIYTRHNKAPVLSKSDLETAAAAFEINAKVWSFDRAFRENPANVEKSLGIQVAPESSLAYDADALKQTRDYRTARKLTGLATDFEISVGGRIQKIPPKKPPSKKGSGGGLGGGGGIPAGTPPDLNTPGARGQKVSDGIELGLKGVNFIIQKINDKIQADRMKESWARIQPEIERRLADDPSTGVLIIVQFGQREKQGAEHESPLEHTSRFLGIDTEYGQTESEAWAAWTQRPRVSDGSLKITYQRTFIQPRQGVDIRKIQTPFPAYGLGTFLPGRASLMKVRWKGKFGFDEEGDVKLEVPKGQTARFLLLSAPAKISFLNGAISHTTTIPRVWTDAAMAEFDYSESVWVVDMDRGLFNVGNDMAAMVFPADNATARLFEGVGRTADNLGQLKRFVNIDTMRWVRPENIHVLRKFAEDNRVKSDTPEVIIPKEPPLP